MVVQSIAGLVVFAGTSMVFVPGGNRCHTDSLQVG